MKQAPPVTAEDLVRYGTFSDTESLPKNHEKLIQFASDLVMYSVGGNYDSSRASHILSVTKAICCQVSYWVESGINPMGGSEASSYSLGELSVTVGGNTSAQGSSPSTSLCPMASVHLKSEYLLYRGLRHGRSKTALPTC